MKKKGVSKREVAVVLPSCSVGTIVLMVEYIEADELAQLIRKKVAGEHELLVVDVRTGDYGHGHIRGSVHLNFDFVQANPKSVAAMIKSYDMVVFHCMYSQSRGPSCASLLYRTLRTEYPESETQIKILRGGYATFASIYRNDGYLLEDFDPGLFDELSE